MTGVALIEKNDFLQKGKMTMASLTIRFFDF